jgi:PAS domain S-box-containing protein
MIDQGKIGLRQLFLLVAAIAGLWASYVVSEIFRDDARQSWEAQANQSAQWLSGTLLGWLDESYAPLSGIAALFENSETVSEAEFLNAYDGIESRASAFFLDGMAFYRESDSNGKTQWTVEFATDQDGLFSSDNKTVGRERILNLLRIAKIRVGEFIIGEPFLDESSGAFISPVALSTFDRSGEGIVVGLMNYDALVKGLFDVHVPEGLSLEMSAHFADVDGFGDEKIIRRNLVENILSSVATKTVSAGADISITWHFDNRYLGGPSQRLADFTLFAGIASVIAIALMLGLLLQRDQIITRRVAEATDQLNREQQITDMALENMDQGITMFDEHSNLVASNDKFFELMNFPHDIDRENLTLEGMFRIVAQNGDYGPGDIETLVTERLDMIARNEAMRFELTLTNGSTIDVRSIPLASGGMVRTYSDITGRKEIEKALSKEKETLGVTLENMDQGITMYDADLKLVASNAKIRELNDVPDDIYNVGTSIEEGFRYNALNGEYGPGDPEEQIRVRMDLARKFEAHHFERIRPDGTVIEIRGQPVPGGGIVTTYRDITARKASEAQIGKLSSAIEQSSASIIITDPDGAIEYVNSAFTKTSGFSSSEVVGLPFRILKPGFLAPGQLEKLWQTVESGGIWHDEFLNKKKSGEDYWESISLSRLINEEGEITNYLGIKEDITDRKEVERELKSARYEAEAASQAKAEFLASMSHEIRTPMNGVVGMADLLSQTKLDEDQRVMLDTVRDSGNSLLTIINDILDFSKIEAGKLDIESVPLSIVDTVEGAAATMAPNALNKGVRIVTYIDPEIPESVLGDPVRLRQMVFNLTGNAVKFSEEGEVVVRADAVTGEGDEFRIRISVIDQGIGISEEAQKNLFGAFSQAESSTTRRFGGTGLGLAICKNLCEMMHGQITVESKIGSGSTFSVELPIAKSGEVRTNTDEINLSGLRVLVATGVEALGMSATRYLQRWLADVVVAKDESEASAQLDLAIKDNNPFDVVVLDFGLDPDRQRAAMKQFPNAGVNFILLSSGQRRSARIEGPDRVTLDGNPVRQVQLINAVAVAAGRASPLVRPDVDEGGVENVVALSVDEALAQGTLILLAEDNMTNQQVIGRQLTKLGYTCEMADDGKLALDAWRKKDYALLLTDCHMPNMDGFELTASVRQDQEGTGKRSPIIAVTANALEGEAERCIAAGMDDYLSKPLAMKDLKATLRKWMPNAVMNTAPSEKVEEPAEVEAEVETVVASNKAVEPRFLRDTFGDDDELIKEILMDFVQPARDTAGEIDAAFTARDTSAIGAAAHKLKSSSRSVGAEGLADLCADLEKAGKADDWPSIEGLYPGLASLIEVVATEIEAL